MFRIAFSENTISPLLIDWVPVSVSSQTPARQPALASGKESVRTQTLERASVRFGAQLLRINKPYANSFPIDDKIRSATVVSGQTKGADY
ncbi:hypothetical protein GCM10028805_14320 [Spirosoma harenae]